MATNPYNQDSATSLLIRLIKTYVKPELQRVIQASICMIIVAIASALHVWMIKPALDQIFLSKNQSMLFYIPIAVIVIALIKGGAAYYQNYLMKYVGQRVVTNIQTELYEHLIKADIEFLYNQSTGKLISKFTNDIMIMRGAVSNLLTGIVKELLTVVFLIILMFHNEPVLSVIAFLVFPLAVVPILKMGRRMRKLSYKTQEELGHYTAQLDDTFQAIRIIKSYRREDFEASRARKIIETIFGLYVKAVRTESLSSPLMETLSGVAIASVIWYGGMQVIEGVTSPGSFFSFIVAFIAAYKPVKTLADLNTNLQEGLAATKRVFSILDIKPIIVNKPDAKPIDIIGGHIAFNNVTFIYPNGKKALDSVSIEIPSGKTAALVGLSGSGKSTIINLLMRFYDPAQGNITIDNQDISSVTLESLRDHISIVTQEIMLFDDTVAANISYGKLDANKDEIMRAAMAADAHDFIMTLPAQYDTTIGQHGLKLSGGQRQRLALARAILKNSPVLLLDEATSSLDSVTEQRIQHALSNFRHNRTTLIVAHRLSTIMDADIIYVIKHGKIVEHGNHQQLLSLGGEYSSLYNSASESGAEPSED